MTHQRGVARAMRPGSATGPRATTLAALAVLALLALAAPAGVSAHALLRESVPAAGSTLGTAPEFVSLTFSEAPDPALTSVRVLDTGGVDHVVGEPGLVPDQAATIRLALQPLPDGVYTVSWRTVSAVDGHISAGTFSFGIGVAAPTGEPDAGAGAGQAGSPAAIVARWILYLGLLALLGAAFVALVITRGPAPDLLAMAAGGWLLTAAGTAGVIGVQWLETGAPLETIVGTSVGAAAAARAIALAAVGAGLAALAVIGPRRPRSGWSLVGLAAVAVLVVDVATGHAAAGDRWPGQVAIQSLHGLTAGTWLGGLAALLVALRGMASEERLPAARRFSTWAGLSLAVVAVTGIVRAVGEVQSIDNLLSTDFGRVVLAKSGLLLAIAALGALNRFVNLRNAGRAISGLRRLGSAEIVLAVAVIGLSALLVNLTPPSASGEAPAPRPAPIVAQGSDFGTSVRVRLVANPGPAGVNEFDLAVVDFDTGEPVPARAAGLRFELLSQAGVEPSTLGLQPAAGNRGRFSGSGGNLAVDGIWRITATISGESGTVEVPLLAATSIGPQPTERLVSAGLPTIYTIQLGAPGFAQVYLDPGTAGPNELHVTYFDPAGGELPLASADVLATPASGAVLLPEARMLQAGHFVASVDVPAGPLVVDVVSPLPAGSAGHVHLRVTIEVEP